MDRLYMNYTEIDSVLRRMQTCKTNINNNNDTMSNIVKGLLDNGHMEGETADGYLQEFEQILGPDLQSLSELLDSYSKQLSDISSNVAAADKAVGSMLKA